MILGIGTGQVVNLKMGQKSQKLKDADKSWHKRHLGHGDHHAHMGPQSYQGHYQGPNISQNSLSCFDYLQCPEMVWTKLKVGWTL